MSGRDALAARRQLLVACATLQRVRLSHDWQQLRSAVRPGRWAAASIGAAVLALALPRLADRAHDSEAPRPGAWAARAFALWRIVRALRRSIDAA